MHWADHLIIVPVVLPLLAAALMLLLEEHHRQLRFAIDLAVTIGLLITAIALMHLADMPPGQIEGWSGSIGIYLAANWPAPFGIALVSIGCPR